KEYERVGERRTRRANVRVVAATNRDIERDVRDGRFRADLLFRLSVVEITIPSLRDRPEDIVPLARHFIARLSEAAGRTPPELAKSAEQALLAYAWPGNVRELRNAIERALLVWPKPSLDPAAFPGRI